MEKRRGRKNRKRRIEKQRKHNRSAAMVVKPVAMTTSPATALWNPYELPSDDSMPAA